MAEEGGFSIGATAFKILGAGLIITFMVVGAGFTLPFFKIPWYIWAFLVLIFVLFISRK